MKKRHGEEEIIYTLKRIEAESKGMEVFRELGISEQLLIIERGSMEGWEWENFDASSNLKRRAASSSNWSADLNLDKHIWQEVVWKKL